MNNIILIISFCIILILSLILIVFLPRYKTTNYTQQSPETFLNYCSSDNDCSKGYSCDSITALCKGSIGTPCFYETDCSNPLICNGICILNENTNVLNGNCPCNPSNLICVELENRSYTCKNLGGLTCSENSDCYSQFCNNGICSFGNPNGYFCDIDTDCESNFCSNGVCQDFGMISGNLGSYCVPTGYSVMGGDCSTNLICIQNRDSEQISGNCYFSTPSVFPEPCYPEFQPCEPPYTCNRYFGTTNSYLCDYNSINPNIYPIIAGNPIATGTQLCISGMIGVNENSTNLCIQDSGIGCDNSNFCEISCNLQLFNLMKYTPEGIQSIFTGSISASKIVNGQNEDIYILCDDGIYLYNGSLTQVINQTGITDICISSNPLENNSLYFLYLNFVYSLPFTNTNYPVSISSLERVASRISDTRQFDIFANSSELTDSNFMYQDANLYIYANSGANLSIANVSQGMFYYDIQNSFGMTGLSECSCPYESGKLACCTYTNYLYIQDNILKTSGNVSAYSFTNKYTNLPYPVINFSLYNSSLGFLNSRLMLYCEDDITNYVVLCDSGNLQAVPFSSNSDYLMTTVSENNYYIATNGTCF